jgi:hypothetical protein
MGKLSDFFKTREDNPEYFGKKDAREDTGPYAPKPDMMDRIFGATEQVKAAGERYTAAHDAEKAVIRDEQNNEYLREIAENLKKR